MAGASHSKSAAKPADGTHFNEIAGEELKKLSERYHEATEEKMRKIKERVAEEVEKRASPSMENRVPTGIPGFDELVQGGLEKNSTTLLIGGAGTGKTTFLLEYLYNGAVRYNQPGVFLSFEEPREKLFKHMKLFGWDFAELEKKRMFTYLQYAPHQVKKIMEEGGGTIRDAIEDMKHGTKYETVRFGMDSLTSFIIMFREEYEARENTIKFFQAVSEWNCTSLVTVEPHSITPDSPRTDVGVEFMVDGVIALYSIKSGDIRETALEVLKMRATDHIRKICPYKFASNGIEVYPTETVFGAKMF
jgi:KaiC/GvpD/RAD55 family RecA-like ATPase